MGSVPRWLAMPQHNGLRRFVPDASPCLDTAPKARMRRHINDVDGRLHPFHLLVRGTTDRAERVVQEQQDGLSAPQCEGIVECYFGIDRQERRLPYWPISKDFFVSLKKACQGETHL